MNLFQKILVQHGIRSLHGSLSVYPDQVLTHDGTGTPIFLQLEAIGLGRVKPFTVVYNDHNTLQVGFRNADDHFYLQRAAQKFGAVYSRPGNGICHQVHLENFAKPGLILLGSDSHTSTAGSVGMIAIGSGGLDVVTSLAGEPFHLAEPKIVGVHLEGRMPEWSTGRDLILHLLKTVGVQGGVDRVFEFYGSGVATLTVFDRATICNMGAETGSTTSLFPSDEQTRLYLKSFGREPDWVELKGDRDARYDAVIEIELSAIEPLIALPDSPDHVKKVSEVEGLPVDQVGIGSCTNSSYKDLMVVAAILKGQNVHPDVDAVVSPGSRRTLSRFSADGGLQDLIDSGVRLLESACGPCNGIGQSPRSGAVSLRTYNRNFKGRSGTLDARVYLASPETAAVSALYGRITDPRKFGRCPSIPLPDSFPRSAGMFIMPVDDTHSVEVIKGPNIKPIPLGTPLPDRLDFPVELKTGDDVTTDHLLPGGAEMLSLRSNVPASIPYVFNRLDPQFAARVASLPENWAVVGGKNFGQGSAREHAVMVPMSIGMKVVIAKSFARIFRQNMINNGLVPLVFSDAADYDSIQTGDALSINHFQQQVEQNRVSVENKSQHRVFETFGDLTARERELLFQGGLLRSLQAKYSQR